MKQTLSISLAILVMVLSLKMTVAVHYCGNEIAEASIGLGKPNNPGCGMENNQDKCKVPVYEENSCCNDFISDVSLDTEYNHIQKTLKFGELHVDKIAGVSELLTEKLLVAQESIFFYRPPPELSSVSLPFIQVFII